MKGMEKNGTMRCDFNLKSVFVEPKYPSPRGEGSVVRRTVNDRTQNFGRERSERHSDADYIFLYNKVMASLVPLFLFEGNLIAPQSDAWIRGCGSKNRRARRAQLMRRAGSTARANLGRRIDSAEKFERARRAQPMRRAGSSALNHLRRRIVY